MKKVLFCSVILFLALTATAFASREEIDAAISAYEAVVVEAEALAQAELLFDMKNSKPLTRKPVKRKQQSLLCKV